MKSKKNTAMREVPLPFSDGLLSANLWQVKDKSGKLRYVVGVPKLGLSSYGKSESEASFRLFSCLIKYYRQLKANEDKLSPKASDHLTVLSKWMQGIEERMVSREESKLVSLSSRRLR